MKVELPPWNILFWKLTFRTLSFVIRSDEGLTLETSAFEIFYGGNSAFINSFDKTQFLFRSTTESVPVSLETRNLFTRLLVWNNYANLCKCKMNVFSVWIKIVFLARAGGTMKTEKYLSSPTRASFHALKHPPFYSPKHLCIKSTGFKRLTRNTKIITK